MMQQLNENEMEIYRLVLIRPRDLAVLVTPVPGGVDLPRVAARRWTRPAEELQMAILIRWGIRCVLLDILLSRAGHPSYAVAEMLSERGDRPLHFAALAKITDRTLAVEDREGLQRLLLADSATHAAASRPGWARCAMRWVEKSIPDSIPVNSESVLQLNAGGGFALLRFQPEGRCAYWLKATGEPNRHEFAITATLANCLPQFLPKVLAMREDWNAWLMEDGGTALSKQSGLEAWESAVVSLARLQQESIPHLGELEYSGCRNQRLSILHERLGEMIEYLSEAMSQQVSTKVQPLNQISLAKLHCSLQEACEHMEALEIPDTLVHGDMNPGNILFDGRQSTFIDWAEASIGNPLLCFERLMVHFKKGPPEIQDCESHLRGLFRREWLVRIPIGAFNHLPRIAPLLAQATCLLDRGEWMRSSLRSDPGILAYARSMARGMYRFVQSRQFMEMPC